MRRMLPLLMLLALLLCACANSPDALPASSAPSGQTESAAASPPAEPQPTEQTEPERLPPIFWDDNMLRQDFWEVLGVSRSQIRTATFLSVRKTAPEWAVELSSGSGSVLGWIEDGEHLYIAADRGINGAESAMGLFEGCISLRSVTFGDAYRTDLALSMERMFFGCKSLTEADVENLITSSASHMSHLFEGCISLPDPAVSRWDTSSVTDMEGIFRGCLSLETPDVSSWNVEKAVTMESMFEGCASLRQLELSGWNPEAAENMAAMFKDCSCLQGIGSFPYDHPAVDDTTFSGCGVLNP